MSKQNGQKALGGIVVTAGQLALALPALRKLAGASFPALEAFAIARLLARIDFNADVAAAENTRAALVRKYGKDEGGGRIQVQQGSPEAAQFEEEYAVVSRARIRIASTPLKVAVLEHAPVMTPMEMMALAPLMEKETETE